MHFSNPVKVLCHWLVFAASYWLQFDKKIEPNERGAALADVLSCVPNIKITDSLMVTWARQAVKNGMSTAFIHKYV